jgi:hypothetical protein
MLSAERKARLDNKNSAYLARSLSRVRYGMFGVVTSTPGELLLLLVLALPATRLLLLIRADSGPDGTATTNTAQALAASVTSSPILGATSTALPVPRPLASTSSIYRQAMPGSAYDPGQTACMGLQRCRMAHLGGRLDKNSRSYRRAHAPLQSPGTASHSDARFVDNLP